MRELEIAGLYDSIDEQKAEDFTSKMDSKMRVKTDYFKEDNDFEWIGVFEELLPYIEKILRNPKRFITTEEEIVKIESAKKVGVETVKHLAKHTNFVQDIDEDTGDVIPSKLLNVLKEETFNTYENRFIYTLIQRMTDFVRKKKEQIKKETRLKDNKQIEYSSSTFVGEEKVNVNISLNTALDTNVDIDKKMLEKIKKIEDNIKDLKYTEVYKALEKEGVPLVTPPIKKTNVILKNVNFQYAMQLWNYVNENITKRAQAKKQTKDYMETGNLKGLIDETFLLEYITVSSINNDSKEAQQTKERAISRMLDRIIDLNPELTKKELQEKLGAEYDKVKETRAATKSDIEKLFRRYIDKFLQRDKVAE